MRKLLLLVVLVASMFLASCTMLDWEHHHLPDSMRSMFESTVSTFNSPLCQYNTCIE